MPLMYKAMAFARLVKRTVVCISIVSLLALPAYSFSWGHHHHSPSPQLVIDGHAVLFTVLPVVDSDHEFLAPVDFVHMMGAEFTVASGSDTLTVTGLDGRTVTSPYTRNNDRCIVDVAKVAQGLGADVDWNDKDAVLTLRAKVLSVRVSDGKLNVATSYPVNYATGALSAPPRIYVDLTGAVLAESPTSVAVGVDGVQQIRSKQLDFNTARIALDMNHVARVAPASSDKFNKIEVALGTTLHDHPVTAPPVVVAAAPPIAAAPTQVKTVATTTSSVTVPTEMASGAKIIGISTQTNTDGKTEVVILTTGNIADGYMANLIEKAGSKPDRYAVDFPATLSLPSSIGDGPLAVNDPDLKSVRWGTVHTDGKAFARVVLDLAGPLPYHVTSTIAPDGTGTIYTISPGLSDNPAPTIQSGVTSNPIIPPPSNSNGSIKGMLIVVDPGHGGKDTGAPGANGLFEKNLTLAIGKDVRDALLNAGARVLMTREDDTFIPLPTRSQVAIDNQADYFISVHCDSGNSRNAQEGSTVYYHSNDAVCKTLALCIASRFNEANLGIKSDGVRTDYVRFPGAGFSVLRRAGEPAVLCECGYVNDDDDAKALNDPATQKQIAACIVAGLKDFVGNKVASR